MVTKVSEELAFSIFSVDLDYPDMNFRLLIYISVIPVSRRKFCMHFWCLVCMLYSHSPHPSSFDHVVRNTNYESPRHTTSWTSPVRRAGTAFVTNLQLSVIWTRNSSCRWGKCMGEWK